MFFICFCFRKEGTELVIKQKPEKDFGDKWAFSMQKIDNIEFVFIYLKNKSIYESLKNLDR